MSSKKKITKQRGTYSKEALVKALEAVKKGSTMRAAAQKYHIPRTTLFNRKRLNYTVNDKRPGPESVLTQSEEQLLVQWVIDCSKENILVSKQHLLDSVALIVELVDRKNPFNNNRPGKHWYKSFLSRNENIHDLIMKNRSSTKLAAKEEAIKNWFCNVKKLLNDKNLTNIHPSRLFTTENVMIMSPNGNENEENLCLQITGSADGILVPPMVVFVNQRIPHKITEKLPDYWTCGKSDDGCMSPTAFHEYVIKGFYPWLLKNEIEFPVVLFMDGKVPYLTLPLSDFCKKNKIEIVPLHPNANKILQPLEVTMFPSLKTSWIEALKNYRLQTGAVNLLKEDICPLLKIVIDEMDTAKDLIEGFELCGLYPLSENMVNYPKVPKKPVTVEMPKVQRVEYVPPALDEPAVSITETKTISNKDILSFIEQEIDIVTLHTFKKVKENELWTGRAEDTSLFYLWRKVLNASKNDEQNESKVVIVQQNNTSGTANTYYPPNPIPVIPSTSEYLHHQTNEVVQFQINNSHLVYDPIKLCMSHMNDI